MRRQLFSRANVRYSFWASLMNRHSPRFYLSRITHPLQGQYPLHRFRALEAESVAGQQGAHSTEFDPGTPLPAQPQGKRRRPQRRWLDKHAKTRHEESVDTAQRKGRMRRQAKPAIRNAENDIPYIVV
jgi:hypothetical protein